MFSCKATYSMLIFVLVFNPNNETSLSVENQNKRTNSWPPKAPETICTDFIQPPLIILKHFWPRSLNEWSNRLAARSMENALCSTSRSIQSGFIILV